jgi:Bacteriophage tail sheath protein
MDDAAPGQAPEILAVGTSTAGFVGATGGGPDGQAVLVTSFVEYQRTFGTAGGELAQGVRLFFENDGLRAYVVRAESHVVAALAALEGVPVSLIALPDTGGLSAGNAANRVGGAADVCERQRWFLLVDPPSSLSQAAVEAWARDLGSLPNAAVYVPRLRLPDGTETAASGAVAGVVARTDLNRGVWVTPAGSNGRLDGVVDVTRHLPDDAAEHAASVGINPIRRLESSIRIWGARTLSVDDPKWKYVSVRRLALFIEESIDEGTRWAVFEPNGEPLWSRVREAVEGFMLRLFQQGAFQGTSPDEAYFVRCDRTTMTQDDIDNGRLVVLVGFAPIYPAEFMTIRIA